MVFPIGFDRRAVRFAQRGSGVPDREEVGIARRESEQERTRPLGEKRQEPLQRIGVDVGAQARAVLRGQGEGAV